MIGETITDTLMNTLHKSLTIAILAVSIFISGLTVDLVSAQNTAEGAGSARRPADALLSRYLGFSRLTSEEGLSNDQVWGVAQDNHSFMWFATSGGLNRYDGAGFRIYRHDPDDPSSLSRNLIRALAADQSGLLWIGTWGGGLNQGTGSAASYRSS
jgi:ligand-binding sensor domain-containing protein